MVPYFERGSLRDAITAACLSSSPLWPFTQRTALHLFHGICSGVLALHRAGFCHRDIRPHNILLSSSSTGENFLAYIPVVTHFGSCVPIHGEGHSHRCLLERQSGVIHNSSAPYQAPESFEPAVDIALDGQSDVWSLGCVLYVQQDERNVTSVTNTVLCFRFADMQWHSEKARLSTRTRYSSHSQRPRCNILCNAVCMYVRAL